MPLNKAYFFVLMDSYQVGELIFQIKHINTLSPEVWVCIKNSGWHLLNSMHLYKMFALKILLRQNVIVLEELVWYSYSSNKKIVVPCALFNCFVQSGETVFFFTSHLVILSYSFTRSERKDTGEVVHHFETCGDAGRSLWETEVSAAVCLAILMVLRSREEAEQIEAKNMTSVSTV